MSRRKKCIILTNKTKTNTPKKVLSTEIHCCPVAKISLGEPKTTFFTFEGFRGLFSTISAQIFFKCPIYIQGRAPGVWEVLLVTLPYYRYTLRNTTIISLRAE